MRTVRTRTPAISALDRDLCPIDDVGVQFARYHVTSASDAFGAIA